MNTRKFIFVNGFASDESSTRCFASHLRGGNEIIRVRDVNRPRPRRAAILARRRESVSPTSGVRMRWTGAVVSRLRRRRKPMEDPAMGDDVSRRPSTTFRMSCWRRKIISGDYE